MPVRPYRAVFLSALCASLLAFASSALAQKTIRVPADQPSIQAGIDAAATGDTVLVSPGTYNENLNITRKEITLKSTDGAQTTILDGGRKGPVIDFLSTFGTASVIDGFTIRNGQSPYWPQYSGIHLNLSGATIQNNIVTHNYGVGIAAEVSTVNIINNQIDTADPGGFCQATSGIYLFGNLQVPLASGNYVPSVIRGNTISGSSSACDGGGMYGLAVFNAVIENNVIRNSWYGMQFYIVKANIRQNLIYGNRTGGIYLYNASGIYPLTDPADIFITNNTIVNNLSAPGPDDAKNYGEVILDQVYARMSLSNNIIAANSATSPAFACSIILTYENDTPVILDHNDIVNTNPSPYPFQPMNCSDDNASTEIGLNGNKSIDPLFLSSMDFHLRSGSPAIDAGNNSAYGLPVTDLDGNQRILDTTGLGFPRVDMGAYEAAGIATLPTTTVILTSSTYFVQPNQVITLTASPGPIGGAPAGSITMFQDDAPIDTQAVTAGGTTSKLVGSLPPGLYRFTATYTPIGAYAPSISTVIYVRVPRYTPTLKITSTPNPSLVNQTVTFSVKIASPDTNQLGPITVLDSSTNSVLATLTPDSTGNASFTNNALAIGNHVIVASYAGDKTHNFATASLTQQVLAGYVTDTTLTSSQNPSVINQSVTFTATVTSSNGTPTGSVQFSDGSTVLGSGTLNASGTASITNSSLSIGTHIITATYTPSGSFATSSGTLSQQVLSGYATSTSVSSSPNPSLQGQPVTFTASVSSTNGTPTGSVQFVENQVVLFTAPVDGSGHAAFTTSTLSVGLHTIYANYQAAGNFAGSSGQIDQNVQAISNAINLTSSLNPSNYGDPITFTAYVTTNSGQTLTGNVTFYAGSSYLGQVAVDPTGKAAFTLTNPTNYFGVGAFNIIATFLPAGSQTSPIQTSIVQRVVGLPTTTLLTANPITGTAYNNTITLTATVAAVAAGRPVPTGSVLFYGNSGQLSYVPLVNGVATLSTALPGGVNHVYGVFYPDASSGYNGSTSNTVDVTINAAPSALSITSNPNPSLGFTVVNLSAQLTTNGSQPGPTGLPIVFTVTSLSGAVVAQGAPLTNASGIATVGFTLVPGTYLVTANFAGNLFINSATSSTITQVVNPLSTVTTLTAQPNPGYEDQPVTLNLGVSSPFPSPLVTPVGSLVVYDGSTILQTLPLGLGQPTATFTLNNLAVGTHTLTAVYTPIGGNFLSSTSAPLSLIILPQSFTVTLSDDNLTLVSGHHRSLTVSIASIGGLTAPFTVACGTNLPQWTSCQWGETNLTLPANGTVSTSLTLDTNQLPGFLVGSATSAQNPAFWNIRFAALPVLLLAFFRRRALRASLPRLMVLLMFALAVGMVSACGANKYPYSTAPGTYSVPLVVTEHPTTAGSNVVTKTVTVTLTVTN